MIIMNLYTGQMSIASYKKSLQALLRLCNNKPISNILVGSETFLLNRIRGKQLLINI